MQILRPSRTTGRLGAVALVVVSLAVSTWSASPEDEGAAAAGQAVVQDTTSTAPAAGPSAAPSGTAGQPGPDEVVLGPDAAVAAIGDDLDEVAALNRMTTDQLTDALQDPTYGVGPDGRLFVAEFMDDEHADEHGHAAEPTVAPVAQAAVVPLSQTFELNSLPGSNRTIYLDFTGHTLSNTVWNSQQGIPNGRTVPPFSLDASPEFSDAELQYVQNVWLAVAEDYAPFDVNVTTQDPGTSAITRSSPSDQVYGARAIVTTPKVQSDFPSSCPITSTCAGLAYVGVFDASGNGEHRFYEGAFVNAAGVTNPLELTTILSHEVGHNAGLNHAGFNSQGYYSGTGNWGPIMGTPYARALNQWSQHAYEGANNTDGPDVARMATFGVVPRADEAGSTIGTAAPSGWTTSRKGLVSAPGDQDLWDLGRCEGTVTITATPSTYSTNLDISLSLVTGTNASPVVLETADPQSGQTGSGPQLRATGVASTVTLEVEDASYYALVRGSTSGPDGGYGNLGPYTLSATCEGVSVPPVGIASFTDVPSSAVFFAQIEWLAGQGISTGYDNGNGTKRFEPSAAVLREQMAAFIARYADADLPVVSTAPFTDVAASHVFARHIRWLADEGISTGYDNGNGTFSFRPGAPVLREQMAAFLYRLAGATATSTTCGFTDVPPSHTFAKQICWLASEGISTGYEEPNGTKTFRPGQPVLREQMAAFLFRYDDAGL